MNKKVLIIQHYTGIGGSSLGSLDVAKALKEIGYEVKILMPGEGTPLAKMAADKAIDIVENCPPVINFTFHSASSGIFRALFKLFKLLRYKKKWQEILIEHKPDLVLLNSSAQMPMIKIIKELGMQCICYVRETVRPEVFGIVNRIIRSVIGKADRIFFLTPYDLNEWNLDEGKQFIIPDIVDNEYYSLNSVRKDNDTFSILYLGGFSYEKGILELVRAMDELTDINVTLDILGEDGSVYFKMNRLKRVIYSREVKAICQSKKIIDRLNKVEQRIYIRGIQRDMGKWYSRADVIVFPVKKVHQARPIFEAGWYSIPAIAPDFENFKDSIVNGYNGLLYKKNDSEDLAIKIRQIYNSLELRQELGKNNRCMTEKKHSEQVIQQLLEVAMDEI